MIQQKGIDLHSLESQLALQNMIRKLFAMWRIPEADQMAVLGTPITQENLDLNRVGLLLSIHKSLRTLFPHNPEIRNSWVHRHNKEFGCPPLHVMRNGPEGLRQVAMYLEMYREL